jgi:hypothetical protein
MRSLSPTLYKNQPKWIKEFNIRPETLKLLGENIEEILGDLGRGKDFLNRTLTLRK